jgi:hypothetical protein
MYCPKALCPHQPFFVDRNSIKVNGKYLAAKVGFPGAVQMKSRCFISLLKFFDDDKKYFRNFLNFFKNLWIHYKNAGQAEGAIFL